ncbi:MAG: NADH-quinone oxidoreductase subunit NuoF [Promethearchaeota archaeon]|jgi:NADH-quinone oxidoreductase subunit F
MKKLKTPVDLEYIIQLKSKKSTKPSIALATGTCGIARGADKIADAIRKELKKNNLESSIDLKITGCHGFCEIEPYLSIFPEEIFYVKVQPEDVKEIISKTMIEKKIIEHLLYVDSDKNKKIIKEKDIPFYKKQARKILANNALIDPQNIEDYLGISGYSSLLKVLTLMKPEEVIGEVKQSGLRGRGGAGFPTGFKWEFCRKTKGNTKYIICNADEGDPGAYMDRGLLEGNPHSIIEGMIIGAYAIGANEGFVYIRDEYPLAVRTIYNAIKQARQYGLLGKNILNSNFDFDIKIVRGAGAFVCGEETALISSIEGKKGEPKQRPPFPAQKGIWRKPTNINNVETWANIPLIIFKGAKLFSELGTEKSKGTKIFSLVGKINNTGLVEIPMGITLRELIYGIGGGIPKNKSFKAVQTGGPSGGCIPESLLDTPIDYEKLKDVGSIMGSGGMVVMDENTCMVDVARYFLDFLQDESCGKCLSCREGTKRMTEIVTKITKGMGTKEDLNLLEELAVVVKDTSMCSLGQTAANPVLSTIQYFRDEYEDHIKNRKCQACVCSELIQFFIISEKCVGCEACKKVCPQQAISGEKKKPHVIDQNKCIKCGICLETCKVNAIGKR